MISEPRPPSVFTPFLRRFTDERALDLADAKALHARVRAKHQASPWSAPKAGVNATVYIVEDVGKYMNVPPRDDVRAVLDNCLCEIVHAEDTIFRCPDIDWSTANLTLKEQVDLCRFLRAQEYFLDHSDRVFDRFVHQCGNIYGAILRDLPKLGGDGPAFDVPLISLLKNLPALVDHIVGVLTEERSGEFGLFTNLAGRVWENACAASGVLPDEELKKPLISPLSSKLPPEEMAETYLRGTPFIEFLRTSVPFTIPEESRFEHHWIVAGSGHGKTQTLQYLIANDLLRVRRGEASVVVIDSQGDLIRNISRMEFFANHPERLCLIDPTDIEYPVALNLFDVGLDRINRYSPLDRERTINGILELYDFVMGSLLSAELTQKQGVIFRYITRLMLHIPNATIQTFRELMEPGGFEKYRPYIQELQGTARAFFETEFQSKQFEDTKRQVVRRLWGILENSTFERMFSHPKSKLNLFDEINSGKVILINTAKELLKQQGTEIFGRFFIAMLAQATQERATLGFRMPTICYIDEAQDYFDANVALILEQARKFRVGMVLAHQYVGQLSPKLQESFAANTSIKFAGGVSDRDARVLAGMLRCSPDFIESQAKGHFAAFVRNLTDRAMALEVPFGIIEAAPRMADAQWQHIIALMREKYAVHYTEVESHIAQQLAMPAPVIAPKTRPTVQSAPFSKSGLDHGEKQVRIAPAKAIGLAAESKSGTAAHTKPDRPTTDAPPSTPLTTTEPDQSVPESPVSNQKKTGPIDPDTVDVSPLKDW